MADKERLFGEIRDIMVSLFELKEGDIRPDAALYEDLELDSIDAVDMIVQVQKKLNKRIDPQTFKSVKTVNDVVEVVAKILDEQGVDSLKALEKKQ